MLSKTLDAEIRRIFADVWRADNDSEPPELTEDTVLLESGLDSLGFAIFVSQLEEELGYDPFTLSDDAFYPQTYSEFLSFYEKYKPAEA